MKMLTTFFLLIFFLCIPTLTNAKQQKETTKPKQILSKETLNNAERIKINPAEGYGECLDACTKKYTESSISRTSIWEKCHNDCFKKF